MFHSVAHVVRLIAWCHNHHSSQGFSPSIFSG